MMIDLTIFIKEVFDNAFNHGYICMHFGLAKDPILLNKNIYITEEEIKDWLRGYETAQSTKEELRNKLIFDLLEIHFG